MIAFLLAACLTAPGFIGTAPTLVWDAAPRATSYALFCRVEGEAFQRCHNSDCWYDCWEDEVTRATVCDPTVRYCLGATMGAAVGRYTDLEATDVEWCVRGANLFGESPACSNSVVTCMPRYWRPGLPYDYWRDDG